MEWLARILIFTDINLNNIYILSSYITFFRITAVVLFLLVTLLLRESENFIRPSTRQLLRWALFLIFFEMIVSYVVHGNETAKPLFDMLKATFIVLTIYSFEKIGSDRIKVIPFFLLFSIIPIILGFIQIQNPGFNLDNLIPHNSFIFTEGVTRQYLISERRIVGTYNLAIGFALLLGFLITILTSKLIYRKGISKIFIYISAIVFLCILMLFTHTRSAIYGIVPSLILGYLLTQRFSIKSVMLTSVASLAFVILFGGFYAFVTTHSERSKLNIDANTYYKITANFYLTYAALKDNPFFGMQFGDDLKSMVIQKRLMQEAARDLGPIVKGAYEHNFEVTNHNLFAFYLRNYGIFGFLILMYTIYLCFKKIHRKSDDGIRFMLFGCLIYLLQYSLLHNTNILYLPSLWMLMSVGDET